MKYTWRLFKYSKYINTETDKYSHCNTNIESYSQIIMHSQYDSQNIRKEQWLHIFMESNREIELSLHKTQLKINLILHKPPSLKITNLESIIIDENFKMCLKGRSMAFKNEKINKKFQITFFNHNEANIFFTKFNEQYNSEEKTNSDSVKKSLEKQIKQADKINPILLKKFYDLIGNVKIHFKTKKSFKTKKTKKELVEDFNKLFK